MVLKLREDEGKMVRNWFVGHHLKGLKIKTFNLLFLVDLNWLFLGLNNEVLKIVCRLKEYFFISMYLSV